MIAELLQSVLSAYHAKHDLKMVPVKVDDLRPMVEERGFADRIIWEKYDFPAENIAAQVTFYNGALGVYAGGGDYARIQYSSSLNFCWRRFVICKEMYHCLIDKPGDKRISNVPDLLKLSEYLVGGAVSSLEEFAPHATEQDAEILAIETLFPMELRRQHLDAYKAKKVTDHQLALRYRIPEFYARLAMYPTYYGIVENMRAGKFIDIG